MLIFIMMMMGRRVFFILLVVLSGGLKGTLLAGQMERSQTEHSQTERSQTEPGVSRELARWRAANYRDVRYGLDVELVPLAETLRGRIEIRVRLRDAARDLVLDWRTPAAEGKAPARVGDIRINDVPASREQARFVNEHIIIGRELLKAGENVLRMSFESPISATGASAVTRYRDREDGAEYLYTLFVPSDASTAFPCFDQPDLKARFQLNVAAPPAWTVVSNTEAESSTPNGAAAKFVRFRQTAPISTYVFAFAAGPFAEFRDELSPRTSRLFVRRSRMDRARREVSEVFRINREGVAFFERYFDYKFPFPKYDLVIIPEFPFRGMEHAGATFLREETILFPSDPTANDLWSRADVVLHEAAHQWFGDTVTMRWFDDLWLKEGFAEFMANKAIEAVMPQFDAWKVFYQRTKPLAYDTDATKGTTPIWQEIANLSAAKSAYGNIVYRKAPSVLRQAEFYLGAEQFQRGVRMFLKEHALANAEWADLVAALERSSGQRLQEWAEAWVKRRGMPEVRVAWTTTRRGEIKRLTLEQRDVLGEGGVWPMRLKLLLAYISPEHHARPRTKELIVKFPAGARKITVAEAAGEGRPDFVFANLEDYGYGRFLLDAESRAYLLAHLDNVGDDFLRTLLWGSLWEAVREAEMSPLAYLELATRHVAHERDEVVAQAILARMETAFNRYLSDEQRRELAPRLEKMLSEQMFRAATAGMRITYFRAYRQMATTREAFRQLFRVVEGEDVVPGMTPRPRDRIEVVAAHLAAFGREEAEEIKASLKLLDNPKATDDERRYAFAALAALPTLPNKRKYFEAFIGDKNLAESWIEAGVAPFNHARHADLTLPFLERALAELPTFKRTRKIFFVNTWLAAFIGGQCSPEALQTVKDFLARESSLERDLRLKILEATDGLERCVRIKEKQSGIKN